MIRFSPPFPKSRFIPCPEKRRKSNALCASKPVFPALSIDQPFAASVAAALSTLRSQGGCLLLRRLLAELLSTGAPLGRTDATAGVAAELALSAGVLAALLASRDRHARRLAALHLAHGAGAAEDRGARQLGLRGWGDADGLAVDHVALVLAPDVGARDVAAAGEVAVAVAEDGVRDGAEGGGEEEEGNRVDDVAAFYYTEPPYPIILKQSQPVSDNAQPEGQEMAGEARE
ncbi:hypothetical protein PG997_005953 [Apiospora hydei]|uniref:Uncharacterized protein n=1 Tax=Apiospora hydei TaxID=1337664 RepID=A0ABR1WNQ7_9PEZI